MEGLNGVIDNVWWVNDGEICVVTNLGAYLAQLENGQCLPTAHISWNTELYREVTSDRRSSTLFVVSDKGELKSQQLDKNAYSKVDSMKTVIESGCSSVHFFDDLDIVIYMTSEGLWKVAEETPTMVFKVILIQDQRNQS